MRIAFWLVSFFIMIICSVEQSSALQCKAFLTPSISTAFMPNKPLRFMSLNTLNLYLHQGKYLWTDKGLEKVNQDNLPRQKPEWQTQGLANAILETQPDFLMLQEVEGFDSLDRFNRRYLGDAYKPYLAKTNDSRKIGVAFLVRKGLGVKIKRRSFADITWVNKKGVEEPVFARNFPLFEIYTEDSDQPKLVVAGVHYKSRIDRPNDPKSFFKRQQEIDESVKILKKVREKYSKSQFIVMGDFNSSWEQKELSAFYEQLKMVDAHASDEHFVDPQNMGRSTFVYFPHGEEKKNRAFDLALLSPGLAENLISSYVYRYKDAASGAVMPLPSSVDERSMNPSDHYPIVFDLNPEVLYQGYSIEN